MKSTSKLTSRSAKQEVGKGKFQLPQPDLNKSLNEYSQRIKEILSFATQLDQDKRVTNDVLDIEFQI